MSSPYIEDQTASVKVTAACIFDRALIPKTHNTSFDLQIRQHSWSLSQLLVTHNVKMYTSNLAQLFFLVKSHLSISGIERAWVHAHARKSGWFVRWPLVLVSHRLRQEHLSLGLAGPHKWSPLPSTRHGQIFNNTHRLYLPLYKILRLSKYLLYWFLSVHLYDVVSTYSTDTWYWDNHQIHIYHTDAGSTHWGWRVPAKSLRQLRQ